MNTRYINQRRGPAPAPAASTTPQHSNSRRRGRSAGPPIDSVDVTRTTARRPNSTAAGPPVPAINVPIHPPQESPTKKQRYGTGLTDEERFDTGITDEDIAAISNVDLAFDRDTHRAMLLSQYGQAAVDDYDKAVNDNPYINNMSKQSQSMTQNSGTVSSSLERRSCDSCL